jgi:hypothetical protein
LGKTEASTVGRNRHFPDKKSPQKELHAAILSVFRAFSFISDYIAQIQKIVQKLFKISDLNQPKKTILFASLYSRVRSNKCSQISQLTTNFVQFSQLIVEFNESVRIVFGRKFEIGCLMQSRKVDTLCNKVTLRHYGRQ